MLTNYEQLLLYISYEKSELYIHTCHIKGCPCRNYKVQSEREDSIVWNDSGMPESLRHNHSSN